MPSKDAKTKAIFEELFGKAFIEFVVDNNWIGFNDKSGSVYGKEKHSMEFYRKDGKNDTVCYGSIEYDGVRKKFWAEALVDNDPKFETPQEVLAHYNSLEDDVLCNDCPFVEFPMHLLGK
jgi:hypothetical protein